MNGLNACLVRIDRRPNDAHSARRTPSNAIGWGANTFVVAARPNRPPSIIDASFVI
jgi:hypothetical protein